MKRKESNRRHGCSDRVVRESVTGFQWKRGLLAALCCVSACTGRQAVFEPAPQAQENAAVVYVYRPATSTNFMMSPGVLVNGENKFRIGNGEHRYLHLAEGRHEVALNPAEQYSTDGPVTIAVDANRSYYLRVGTSLKFVADGMNRRRFWLEQVNGTEAFGEIAKTGYSGPPTQSVDSPAVEADVKDGFTTDITRDPFSGRR